MAGLSSDSKALELAHQFEEAAGRVKPKPKAKCPYVVLREALRRRPSSPRRPSSSSRRRPGWRS
eukprot:3354206-Pyramimonas_sp.AAC.1